MENKFDVFTESELAADYESLCWANTGVKRALAQKYGIKSNRGAEIQAEILRGLQVKRFNLKEFTNEDIKWWQRLYPSTGTYKTLKAALDEEPQGFVEMLACVFKTRSEAVYKKSAWSMADKARITDYNNIERYLNEKKNSADKGLQLLISRLSAQTDDFKIKYIEGVKRYAVVTWEKSFENYKEAENECIKLHNDHAIPYNEKRGRIRELNAIMNKNSTVARQSKNYYVSRLEVAARRTFENDIRRIADLIRQKGIDESKIQVKPLSVGVAGIEMLIGDEKRALYARAIVAALHSVYMRPHYRFIITEKDAYKMWQS